MHARYDPTLSSIINNHSHYLGIIITRIIVLLFIPIAITNLLLSF